ncbi:hypothetical protein PR048_031422 [Dryococelus australis]|uniref:Uncharacterized protein n=1 Tax=Dryococelus australis TaxID=614101 RepID=A0ABQ9G589_9NEOP|nr:hypothetical protein PR048_031422 [Dryococelus australis]
MNLASVCKVFTTVRVESGRDKGGRHVGGGPSGTTVGEGRVREEGKEQKAACPLGGGQEDPCRGSRGPPGHNGPLSTCPADHRRCNVWILALSATSCKRCYLHYHIYACLPQDAGAVGSGIMSRRSRTTISVFMSQDTVWDSSVVDGPIFGQHLNSSDLQSINGKWGSKVIEFWLEGPKKKKTDARRQEVSMRQRRNVRAEGNGRFPIKPANQRHRPARFPRAEVRDRPSRESNPIRPGGSFAIDRSQYRTAVASHPWRRGQQSFPTQRTSFCALVARSGLPVAGSKLGRNDTIINKEEGSGTAGIAGAGAGARAAYESSAPPPRGWPAASFSPSLRVGRWSAQIAPSSLLARGEGPRDVCDEEPHTGAERLMLSAAETDLSLSLSISLFPPPPPAGESFSGDTTLTAKEMAVNVVSCGTAAQRRQGPPGGQHSVHRQRQSSYEIDPLDGHHPLKAPLFFSTWLDYSPPTNRVSIPGGVAPGFSHVGIMPDDVTGLRVFSGVSCSTRPVIPVLLHTHATSRLSAPKTSMTDKPALLTSLSPLHFILRLAQDANTNVGQAADMWVSFRRGLSEPIRTHLPLVVSADLCPHPNHSLDDVVLVHSESRFANVPKILTRRKNAIVDGTSKAWFACTPITLNMRSGKLEQPIRGRSRCPRDSRSKVELAPIFYQPSVLPALSVWHNRRTCEPGLTLVEGDIRYCFTGKELVKRMRVAARVLGNTEQVRNDVMKAPYYSVHGLGDVACENQLGTLSRLCEDVIGMMQHGAPALGGACLRAAIQTLMKLKPWTSAPSSFPPRRAYVELKLLRPTKPT